MQKLRGFSDENATALDGKTIVACIAGIELNTGQALIAVNREVAAECHGLRSSPTQLCRRYRTGVTHALTIACATKGLTCAALQRA